MRLDRKVAGLAVVAVVALAFVGAGIAQAVGGGSEERVSGSERERASASALDAVGGTVLEVERQDGDDAGVYEVEVRKPDGTEVEVHLDAQFRVVGSVADDDGASDADEDEAGPGSDD